MLKLFLILISIIALNFGQGVLQAGQSIGSNSAVSVQGTPQFTGVDNVMLGFAAFSNGINFTDNNTTCSYNDYYPVTGTVGLSAGGLYLQQDLTFENPLTLLDGVSFFGANHGIQFPCQNSPMILPTGRSCGNILTLVATATAAQGILIIDWSFDNKYVAIGTFNDSSAGDVGEVQVFYFNGLSLTLTASADIDNDVRSLRWNPTSYYLAVGVSTAGVSNELQIYNLNVPAGTFGVVFQTELSITPSGVAALSWTTTGGVLAAADVQAIPGINIYGFNSGTGALSLMTTHSTNNLPIRVDWDPTNTYLAVGEAEGGTPTEGLEIFKLTGSTLTNILGVDLGSNVVGVSWSPTGTFIALTVSGGSNHTQVFQFNPAVPSITNVASLPQTNSIGGTSFESGGMCLAYGIESGSPASFEVCGFNPSNDAFVVEATQSVPTAVLDVKWSRNGSDYLAVGSNAIAGVSTLYVYKVSQPSLTFTFNNVCIDFDSDVQFKDKALFQGTCEVDFNGNILDLSQTGTFIIDTNATVALRNVLVKGLGARNNLLFNSASSQLRLANANIELSNNFTTTIGGIYFEGPGTIFLGSNTWTFNQKASVTVDGVTVWKDPLSSAMSGDVLFGSPQANFFTSVNSGTFKFVAAFDDDSVFQTFITNNSNAILSLSAHLAVDETLIRNTSIAVVSLSTNLAVDETLIRQNSTAIVSLNSRLGVDETFIRNNSSAILSLSANLAVDEKLIRDNSSAIVEMSAEIHHLENLSQLIIDNSNAIVSLSSHVAVDETFIRNNSSAILSLSFNLAVDETLIRQNSTAIVSLNSRLGVDETFIRNNSSAILSLSANLAVDEKLIRDNSSAIVEMSAEIHHLENLSQLIVDNSNAIVSLSSHVAVDETFIRNNSSAILSLSTNLTNDEALIRNNSSAIISLSTNLAVDEKLIRDNSSAIVEMSAEIHHLENLSQLIVDNSNAIVSLSSNDSSIDQLVINNSNAIVSLSFNLAIDEKLIRDNSSAIVEMSAEIHHLENLSQLIVDNSNAIVSLSSNDSSIDQLVINNSNAIVSLSFNLAVDERLIRDNSSAIVEMSAEIHHLETLSQLIVDNSNAIISLSNNVSIGNQLTINNSNAIIEMSAEIAHLESLSQLIIDNSNTIIEVNNELETVESLVIDNSNAIVTLSIELFTLVDVVLEFSITNSNADIFNAIVLINAEIAEIEEDLGELSASIISLSINLSIDEKLIRDNSAAIVEMSSEIAHLESLSQLIIDNSNAIVEIEQDLIGSGNTDAESISKSCGNVILTGNLFLSPQQTVTIACDLIIDGSSHFIHFSRTTLPVIFIEPNITVSFVDIVLSDFSPDSISLAAGSKLFFSDGTFIELVPGCAVDLDMTWSFSGSTVLHGGGSGLSFGNNGLIVADGQLLIHDITLQGVQDNNLRPNDDNSSLTLCDVEMVLSNDYSLTTGALEFEHDVVISGTHNFVYSSAMGSTIDSNAQVLLSNGVTFSYDVPVANNNLLYMVDQSSRLKVDGATIYSTPTGLHLTRGTLLFDNLVTISSDGTVPAEAITFGDGIAADDLTVNMLSAAEVNVFGPLEYMNVS